MDIIADVLIAGTGVAGLYTAINLRKDLNVIMLCKKEPTESNTTLAQGGISVLRGEEDTELYIEDTMRAGQYKNDRAAVEILVNESKENIAILDEIGVVFDKDENGYQYTREGAHSVNRIVHCKDRTGKEVEEALLKEAKSRNNIKIIQDAYLVDIIHEENSCFGGIIIKNGKQQNIYSKVTILATGGIGGIFQNSTNKRIMAGDGFAIALKNNIKLKNMNYIQFHPTAFYEDKQDENKFLISESVRGEGGKLININGERFVNELLPRDVVTKAIYEEEEKTKSKFVYLDVSFMDSEFLKKRFPTIYERCLKSGVNITKQPIPVSPAQHYLMGGIEVNLNSKTSMENLYACGEASCTGIHGANRLASNSLLEGLVFSRRAAKEINSNVDNLKINQIKPNEIVQDLDYYIKENRKLVTDLIKSLRGDIVNELVNS